MSSTIRISAAWVWHRLHRVAQSHGKGFRGMSFGYLAGGTEVLIQALAAGARERGAKIHVSTSVRRIVHDGRRCTGVETADGGQHEFDAVVATVPMPLFLEMTPGLPQEYEARLAAIDFIGVVCVVLHLRESITDNYWLNINDSRVPYNGFIEYTHLNPGVTGDGSTIVYVPFYLPRTHPRFSYPDAQQVRDAMASLAVVNDHFSPEWVIDAAVSRDPYAQVICSTGFRTRVPGHRTPIDRLFLIESSQLYPSDRTISGTLDLADEVVELIAGGG